MGVKNVTLEREENVTLEREDISGCLELNCCLDRETAPAPVTVVFLSPHLEDIVHSPRHNKPDSAAQNCRM